MIEEYSFEILPMNLESAGNISSFVKKMLVKRGVEKSIIRRVSIAAYEAEINVVIHSFGGKCEVKIDETTLDIKFMDKGPGIKNIEQAMTEGFSTACQTARDNGFGAGMGLPNIKRACDKFEINSSPNGTNLFLLFNIGEV